MKEFVSHMFGVADLKNLSIRLWFFYTIEKTMDKKEM